MIIRVLDILASILILLGLFNVTRSYKWWLVYTVGSVLFTIVVVSKGLWGLTVMGLITLGIGIKNYLAGRKNEYTN